MALMLSSADLSRSRWLTLSPEGTPALSCERRYLPARNTHG